MHLPRPDLSGIAFVGDPHGDWATILDDLQDRSIRHAVFVGDLGLDEPFEEKVAPLLRRGIEIHWIAGNHDTDRDEYHDHLFESALAPNCLSGTVRVIDGVRIAGLGGVFRQQIWNPKVDDAPAGYHSREEWVRKNKRSGWRKGLSRKHRSTIFPEDFDHLAQLRADVLVSHEAPSSHRYGFPEIDALAEAMQVGVVVHGHHHEAYESNLASGVAVYGLAQATVHFGHAMTPAPKPAMRFG